MKLRGRLLLVTVVVVLLPLIGLWFIAGVERTLREGLEQTAIDGARALAAATPAPSHDVVGRTGAPALYLQESGQPMLLDGYGDDWASWLQLTERLGVGESTLAPPQAPLTEAHPASLALASAPNGLHLLLRVRDDVTRFSRAPGEPGEEVELVFAAGDRSARIELAPAAPGQFVRRGPDDGWPTVIGVWQVRAEGWNLELRVPGRPRPDRLGLTVIDRDGDARPPRRFGFAEPAVLLQRNAGLSAALERLAPGGLRAWLVSPFGYVLASADRRGVGGEAGVEPNRLQALLFERLAADAISDRDPGAFDGVRLAGADLEAARGGATRPIWRLVTESDRRGARVRVAVPVDPDRPDGALLVVERDADALMLLASDAVLRLAGASLLTFIVAAGVVLAFAAWLSLRIRRLQRAAERAVGNDGRVVASLEPTPGEDEVASLSRSMAALLERLRVHQDYLRTLADRLAHELRTPLAMIGSSLDNLEQQVADSERFDPDQARRYLQRAGQGSRRLQRILRAMSQAERLEDALIDEPFERFDLAAMVREYCEARAPAASGRGIEGPDPGAAVTVVGSADLVAQLLDKLFDNALDFTPTGGTIRIGVACRDGLAELTVDNEGPSVDVARVASMFEPMVSHREARSDQPHLGMGLFIARLIAERHGGEVGMAPAPEGTRAWFRLPLARSPQGATN